MNRVREDARPFLILLVMGIVLRGVVAFWTIDLLHPDEHFQTLEPAYHILTHAGYLTWEWTSKVRSWFVPALYTIPLLLVKTLFGLGGPFPIHLCRFFTALCSGGALLGFYRCLRLRKLHPGAIALALTIFCLHPMFVILGAATLSDTWALIVVWMSLPATILLLGKDEAQKSFWAGLLASLSFFVRIQMLAWMSGLAIAVLMLYPIKKARGFILGMGAGILCQGLWDWATWGIPFISTIQNIRINLLMKGADTYGVSPWNAYFSMVAEHFGNFWIAAWSFTVIGALWYKKGRLFEKRDLLVILPTTLFWFAHSVIPHKEVRFLYPCIPGFLYVLGVAVQPFFRALSQKKQPSWAFRMPHQAAVAFALFLLSFWEVRSSLRYNYSNMSELMIKIWEEQILKDNDCLALFGHFGVWSHGNLLQNRPLVYLEKPDARNLGRCPYAVVTGPYRQQFSLLTQGRWPLVMENSWKYQLYRRP